MVSSAFESRVPWRKTCEFCLQKLLPGSAGPAHPRRLQPRRGRSGRELPNVWGLKPKKAALRLQRPLLRMAFEFQGRKLLLIVLFWGFSPCFWMR